MHHHHASITLAWCPVLQFDDAFVKEHFPKFESAEEMKRSLLATTAMERLKELDTRMGDMVQKVGRAHRGYRVCKAAMGSRR
jgi:hypothetical protein